MNKRFCIYDERTSKILFEDNDSLKCMAWVHSHYAKGSNIYNYIWIRDNEEGKENSVARAK